MKNIKYILLPLGLTFSMLMAVGCSNDEGLIKPYDQFVAHPKTPVTTKVVNNSDLIASITSDTTYSVTSGVDATEVRYLSGTGLSMKAFVFEIDLTNPQVRIEASTPSNSPTFGMQPMTKQATYEDFEGHKVWAGINADFYNMDTGVPQGIVYKEGLPIKTTVTDAVNTFFAITKDGKAVIGNQQMYPDIKNNIQEAVGGRVTLLKDGVAVQQTDKKLEPRTCIGVDKEGKKVYMLVVDGRNFHYSNGMNYDDLAKFMKAIGAYQAINLDGGGSSTFFIRNTLASDAGRFVVKNWPTDNGGQERSVANGLIVVSVTN
ncbi:exopolysaccharide biosynthesis protein [Pseudopedobacter saltans DSM 12145]|uniref:Exopolysaccharide biosynthesis protein n=1 Tax=Pseudopedobacter saltans (strain ATCC 51119 / DSM 12145 / JCM 21818 / CCUG 39354 / LMG 10337 / NBRC 100064 / NCIMB 13643) TaxID=762903 RepID=F0S5D1_PSESL|nr:phosphodiester glycosidase family protein [Pseudopedobacter saltans]ADY52076.1 exopolysaccharide biosynthesis protein [Pseudopedobacter saltans DSM 12145]